MRRFAVKTDSKIKLSQNQPVNLKQAEFAKWAATTANMTRRSRMCHSQSQDHARDDWKPIQGTPFVEGSRDGDDEIRRVLEMVCTAMVPK